MRHKINRVLVDDQYCATINIVLGFCFYRIIDAFYRRLESSKDGIAYNRASPGPTQQSRGVDMADIDDSDWDRIIDAFKEANPSQWPDRSMIVRDMVETYLASLAPAVVEHDGAGLPIRHEDDAPY